MKETGSTILILDMQPIDPPVGGGRLRLLGLYHGLGSNFKATYIGTYDWPGEKFRDHQVSETLHEIDIPLSQGHFEECRRWQERAGGRNVIDVSFHQLAHLSSQYLDFNREQIAAADIVVFSHPWLYPLVKDQVKPGQLLVYDSHNVEGYLRSSLLDDGGFGTEIVREVVRIEHELCHAADIVLACSHEDRALFNAVYGVPFEKIRVVPNGVFTGKIRPASVEKRAEARRLLGLANKPTAIFIGSNYPPNAEAARYIVDSLAPKLPEFVFVIAGGVGDGIAGSALRSSSNVVVTGFLDEDAKARYLEASDLAVNPMFSGSGTNIKMFDFMAAGLPIVSTEIGARGIETGTSVAVSISDQSTFAAALRRVLQDEPLRLQMSSSARVLAEGKYSWERISRDLGRLLERKLRSRSGKPPFFSVIIPSYNRHKNLAVLMKALAGQKHRDFEVIIVDQSDERWEHEDSAFGFNLFYLHTKVKGAVSARNTGAFFAQGRVLAFTDDDCVPAADWLGKAKQLFDRQSVIGIEGLVKSDRLGDPAYRPVTNEGFPGVGFMTANLFLTAEVFARINGFDERFDHPHFREDTDLAWRALEYGQIPFGDKVRVYHPPHLRTVERESQAERNTFFEKDVLLLQKHPRRYLELFLKEKHWKNTPGFWDHFMRGAEKYQINVAAHEVMKYYPGQKQTAAIRTIDGVAPAEAGRVAVHDLCSVIDSHFQNAKFDLPTSIPAEIQTNLIAARNITNEVKRLIGDKTHGAYFESSMERYTHYFSIAKTFLKEGAVILDIGNAPGHVGIGLHLLGMKVQGLNLNDCWQDSYPSREWLSTFHVLSHDIEESPLPFGDNTFDAIYFTEVLEHIAIRNPSDILPDFRRVLKPGGRLILSTPNVCNISNIIALMSGKNVFWAKDLFYGSVDRHNREYTPEEVREVVSQAGFRDIMMYGFNCDSNWRNGGAEFANMVIGKFGDNHPLLRNTVMLYACK